VIDEPIASRGDILANTYLGKLVARGSSGTIEHYREAPISSRSALEASRARGRLDVLGAMQYQLCAESGERVGLVFDQGLCGHIDGIVALYYPDKLQFIPNIMCDRDIESLCSLFPSGLHPFAANG
jgi:hypothetical protein